MDNIDVELDWEFNEFKVAGWVYNWMVDLRNLDDWWNSRPAFDFQRGLSNLVSFRESKIHLLKKVREVLHKCQTEMVNG